MYHIIWLGIAVLLGAVGIVLLYYGTEGKWPWTN